MLKTQISSVYKQRRKKLTENHPGVTFLLFNGPEIIRNNDVHYDYRPHSAFYYLTGFDEPGAVLVLNSDRAVMFVLPRDPEKEIWEGERYGTSGAMQIFGMDESYDVTELERMLPALIQGSRQLGYRMGQNSKQDALVLSALETARSKMGRSGKGLLDLIDPTVAMGEMRLFKDAEEIELMRKSAKITAEAHTEIMKWVRPGMNEFEVAAKMDYELRRRGCKRLGYGSIVAGGKNAACLHYRSNNEPLVDGQMLLIDAGGEYEMFSGDITRTFPVGRKFTDEHARLYEIVLRSQKAAIDLAKPGMTLPAIHKKATEVLIDGLVDLGFLSGKTEDLFTSGSHRRFYPHNTSHWLGMDVHDAGLYQIDGSPRKLEPGMVFTIEPGLYVQPSDTGVPAGYRNCGIRIEDDILITEKGCENLTASAPKERAEIEALRA